MIQAILGALSALLGLFNKGADAAKTAEDVKLGGAAQQAADQGAILDAAKDRAQVDAADNRLTDEQLRDSLRTGKQ